MSVWVICVRAFRNARSSASLFGFVGFAIRDSCHVALNRVIADYDRALVKNGMSTFLAQLGRCVIAWGDGARVDSNPP